MANTQPGNSQPANSQSATQPVFSYYHEQQWTFNDDIKTIDYVLVWSENSRKATSQKSVEYRELFESNLMEEGLELEHDFAAETSLHCVKIHCPFEILQRYAEILRLPMPLKEIPQKDVEGVESVMKPDGRSWWDLCCPCIRWVQVSREAFPNYEHELTEHYTRARDYLFNVTSAEVFTPGQKARVAQFILDRTIYARDEHTDVFQFGINRLILNGTYAAAYPIHDGDPDEEGTLRHKFLLHWANFRKWYKTQPADYIRQYFGVRTALYFLWLGYYTRLLLPAAIAGVTCFVSSLYFLPFYHAADDVCAGKVTDSLCPSCEFCSFVNLTNACQRLKVHFVFDNMSTVVFAVFMSFWAVIFLECWKRYSAEITLRWDLTSIDDKDENPRPEYAAKLSKLAAGKKVKHKVNFVTNSKEPEVSFWKYLFPGKMLSLTTMLVMIVLAVGSVCGVILYRMFALSALRFGLIASISATFMNLVCILIFSQIYWKLAVMLTEFEMPRTQKEFDGSLTVKIYILEFINHYSSIAYIAFFKGKFAGNPAKLRRIFGWRQDECGLGGCMLELTQQLAVIMVGKRAFRSVLQVFKPVIVHKVRNKFSISALREPQQWEKDYILDEIAPPLLLPEYIDMVLQYGFVTIFVCAFPLAPLFAFVNNIFELRIDAKKYLLYHRRPTMRRVKDIGVWFDILNYVSQLAVFTNGFIIAFTSNFIPRLVYRMTVDDDDSKISISGYWNYSLSYMAVKDLDMKHVPNTTLEFCRYDDLRTPPWADKKYVTTKFYWTVLAARLGFFIIFENVIVTGVVLLKFLIPDVPQHVKWKLRRRHHMINEMIIKHEALQKSVNAKNPGKAKEPPPPPPQSRTSSYL